MNFTITEISTTIMLVKSDESIWPHNFHYLSKGAQVR